MSLLSRNKLLPLAVVMTSLIAFNTTLPLSPVAAATSTPAYSIDAIAHTITIHPTEDAATQINNMMAYLVNRPDKTNLWRVTFKPGRYVINKRLSADHLQNVEFLSDRKNPAVLRKGPEFNSKTEYLLSMRYAKNFTMKNFDIYGSTIEFNPANYTSVSSPIWQDQGLYFGSSNGVTINMNRFFNFGNAALRIATTESDPVHGINSFNSTVTQNYFRNVYQVTTTSNDTIHGGTSNYLFQGNTFDELRGSLKFASRTGGATNVRVRWNTIRSSSTDGIEMVGYNNMEVSNNVLKNIARHAINFYSNGRSGAGFQWGDNVTFKNNVINGADGGLRFSADPFIDGYQPVPKNLVITNNTFSNIKGSRPVISLVNGSFNAPSITNNKLNGILSKSYIFTGSSLSPQIAGNTADNLPINN